MKRSILLLFVFLALAADSCVTRNIAGPAPAKAQLLLIKGVTELKKNEVLVLDLLNTSQDTLWFPPGYGAQVFASDNGNWIPIKNNYGYASEAILLAPAGSSPYSDAFVPFAPLVDTTSAPITIRVIVTGSVYANNEPTSEQVTAMTELTLQP